MVADEQMVLGRAVLANARTHIHLSAGGSFGLTRTDTGSNPPDEGKTGVGYLICNNDFTFVGFIKAIVVCNQSFGFVFFGHFR